MELFQWPVGDPMPSVVPIHALIVSARLLLESVPEASQGIKESSRLGAGEQDHHRLQMGKKDEIVQDDADGVRQAGSLCQG